MFDQIVSPDNPDNPCFGCSIHNPIGLKLRIKLEGDRCQARFTPGTQHQGWVGYMHGGLISTILDEMMGNCLLQKGKPAVTAEMKVRFIKPIPIDKELTTTAWMVSERSKIVEMAAEIILFDGTKAASATAKFFKKAKGFTGESQ